MEGLLARTAVRLQRDELRQAARRQRHPVAVHRERRTAPSGSTPTAASTPTPTTARRYGHDLMTGAAVTEEEYRAKEPDGRAFLTRADYEPPPEVPDRRVPALLTTGRTVYHFHTRTKTGRAPELNAAARTSGSSSTRPTHARARHRRGRPACGSSRRAARSRPGARQTDIRPGVVFVPFHYGYWDRGDEAAPRRYGRRAANELTDHRLGPGLQAADFKVAAGPASTHGRRELTCTSRTTSGSSTSAQVDLADAFRQVGARRTPTRPTSSHLCEKLAEQCDAHAERLQPFAERYGEERRRRARPAALASSSRAPASGGARPASRPSRPLPDGLRVRHRLDAGRPGRAGRFATRTSSRSCRRARARPPSSSSGYAARMKQAAPQALVVA